MAFRVTHYPPPTGGGITLGKKFSTPIMSQENESDILKRLRNIEGHVRGIARMVENGDYCIDIANQTIAVQSALHKVNTLVLDQHLRTCATTAIRGKSHKERERIISEIMDIFNATGRH